MAVTGFFHHVGTFFLLVATVLLIITDISAPVVSSISIVRVNIGTNQDLSITREGDFPSITFGTFGYCVRSGDASDCSPSKIGYDPVHIVESRLSDVDSSEARQDTAKALTKVMVLHPVATGLVFIAFVMSLGAGFFGSFFAALTSFIAFIVVLVVVITDFVGFALVKRVVDRSNSAVDAQWGSAIWTLLAAGVLSLLATIILLFTCCSARLHKRRNNTYRESKVTTHSTSPPRQRRRFW